MSYDLLILSYEYSIFIIHNINFYLGTTQEEYKLQISTSTSADSLSEIKSTGVDSTVLSEIQIEKLPETETSSTKEGFAEDEQRSKGLPFDHTIHEGIENNIEDKLEDNVHTAKIEKQPTLNDELSDDQLFLSHSKQPTNTQIDKVSTSLPAYQELAADYSELVSIDKYFRTFSTDTTVAQMTTEASGEEEDGAEDEDEEHALADEHLPYYVQSENEAVQQTVSYDAQTGCMWVCPVRNPNSEGDSTQLP